MLSRIGNLDLVENVDKTVVQNLYEQTESSLSPPNLHEPRDICGVLGVTEFGESEYLKSQSHTAL